MDKYEMLIKAIKESKRIVVFTGAGISCPALTNIKDFRSDDGLYNEKTKYSIRPEEIISHSFFMSHTKEFFEFYGTKMVFKDALYNKAHKFFSDLQKSKDVTIITQNIDGLHSLAGSKKVYELHGSVYRNYCMKCNKFYSLNDLSFIDVPRCSCGGIIKPDVVLYEESLDDFVVRESINALSKADLLIVVGTSLTVYPAASFIRYFNGDKIALINKQKTSYDNEVDLLFNEDIIEVINKIENAI